MKQRNTVPDLDTGPTRERIAQAGPFYLKIGRARSGRKHTMLDDSLGRAWLKGKISAQEYAALRKYASHWIGGGLQGQVASADPNRIGGYSVLRGSERQIWHQQRYYAARAALGDKLAFVADHVACQDKMLRDVGFLLGYKSETRGREMAATLLAAAGFQLDRHWR